MFTKRAQKRERKREKQTKKSKLHSSADAPFPLLSPLLPDPGTMKRTVRTWLRLGGRMIDCAQNYLNEVRRTERKREKRF